MDKWIQQEDQSYRKVDGYGNRFRTGASQETVSVTTPEGCQGSGWTEEEALAAARNDSIFQDDGQGNYLPRYVERRIVT